MRTTLGSAAALGWVIDDAPTVERTLDRMAGFARSALLVPGVVRYANEIIEHTRSRDYPAQIAAIREFMERYFRFLNNPVGLQRIRTSVDMLNDIETKGYVWGACDDAATLIATLGMADALHARFRAVALGATNTPDDTAPFTHVICDLFDGRDWCALDVTRPYDLDRPPFFVRTLTMEL